MSEQGRGIMELADISAAARANFDAWVIDTLIEKHERYLDWKRLLANADEHGPVILTMAS